jgi:hypothetical protein
MTIKKKKTKDKPFKDKSLKRREEIEKYKKANREKRK